MIIHTDDDGCRIYKDCGKLRQVDVDTQVYHRTNPAPVPLPPLGVTVNAAQSTHKASDLACGPRSSV